MTLRPTLTTSTALVAVKQSDYRINNHLVKGAITLVVVAPIRWLRDTSTRVITATKNLQPQSPQHNT